MQNSRNSSNSRIDACVLVDSAESWRVFSFHRVRLLIPHIQPRCCVHAGDDPSVVTLARCNQRQQQQPSLETPLMGWFSLTPGGSVDSHSRTFYIKSFAGHWPPVNHIVIVPASSITLVLRKPGRSLCIGNH
ncbi:hypothetical protein NP493_1606g00052 [Ridgeia piscesae]|uniref:Uncharacterized protein n=1 Tax=Ridgeia piscesae TaxID=27915 RepID=A0AAD9JY70_RIDPI|nr:hypothetical protein NP493_1606g00052 [Ridgeia piscesae]